MGKVVDAFKKSHGIVLATYTSSEKKGLEMLSERAGYDFDFENERCLSSGAFQGNFYFYPISNERNFYAYSFLTSPLEGEGWLIWITRGKRDLTELREAMPLFVSVAFREKTGDFDGEKACWECGHKFTFSQVQADPDLPAWRAFRQKIERWEDSFCGGST